MSYAFIKSDKLFPLANPIIVSNKIVKITHNPPITQYVLFIPLPSFGIKINETTKINEQRIIPLIGNAYFIPIKGISTDSLSIPFKIARGIIDSQIKIDFLIIFLCFIHCAKHAYFYMTYNGWRLGVRAGEHKSSDGRQTCKFPQNFPRADTPHDAKPFVGGWRLSILLFFLLIFIPS